MTPQKLLLFFINCSQKGILVIRLVLWVLISNFPPIDFSLYAFEKKTNWKANPTKT